MAKVKAPLLSMGASGQIGKTTVHFPWKGINAVREYVVPSNPKTTAQTTQRGYVINLVALVHTAMSTSTHKITTVDKAAYSLWASVLGITMTWFNTAVRNGVKQYVANKKPAVYRDGVLTPTSSQVIITLYFSKLGSNNITAGDFYYGTSKSAMLSVAPATPDTDNMTATITGLTNGTKYYFQFRPSAHGDYIGANSGIYHATPHV